MPDASQAVLIDFIFLPVRCLVRRTEVLPMAQLLRNQRADVDALFHAFLRHQEVEHLSLAVSAQLVRTRAGEQFFEQAGRLLRPLHTARTESLVVEVEQSVGRLAFTSALGFAWLHRAICYDVA